MSHGRQSRRINLIRSCSKIPISRVSGDSIQIYSDSQVQKPSTLHRFVIESSRFRFYFRSFPFQHESKMNSKAIKMYPPAIKRARRIRGTRNGDLVRSLIGTLDLFDRDLLIQWIESVPSQAWLSLLRRRLWIVNYLW